MKSFNRQYWGDAITKNCVWLFQTKHKEYPKGCQCDIYDEEGDLKDGKTQEDINNCECFHEYWMTENVFLTREEAKVHGRARPYAWGEENEGWRIYGVMCIGLMAEFLGKHIEEFKEYVDDIYPLNDAKTE